MTADTTIAAIATPSGRGGVGVVRVSGPAVRNITVAIFGQLPPPRVAQYGAFRDASGNAIDRGLALFFSAPHSYTGEDVLELHGHGGPVVLDAIIARLLGLGATLARAGEFTERAFLNGKLDLAQAEAVADLIDAGSTQAARAALRSLEGQFSVQVRERVEEMVRLRMYVEAAIDFPEEEIDFLADARVQEELAALGNALDALLASAHQGSLLHDGMTIVLAGPPNAGKSSLLNVLAQQETAIVSATPGTTRDVLRERIHIDGLPLHIVDTAGLRESQDEIETEGVRRARKQMERADRILFVIDDASSDVSAIAQAREHLPRDVSLTYVRNKADLSGRALGEVQTPSGIEIALSAKTGGGVEALRAHLKRCAGYQTAGENTFSARRRHVDALRRARLHITRGSDVLAELRAGELLAEELRGAQQALNEITGEFTSDDLLGRIFTSFCIGK